MRTHLNVPLIIGTALLLAAPAAFGGAGIVSTDVSPLSTKVTYSTPATTSPARQALVTYVGYTVTIASDPTNTNTVNNVRFTATTSVTDTAEKATFVSADGAVCVTTNADKTSIECSIGQLRAGQKYPTFAVFFMAPEKTVNGVADGQDEDKVSFAGITYYAEGTGGVDNSVPQNSTTLWSASQVTLGTFNPTSVKSAVPKGGGTLFTGDGAVATGLDTWTTTVSVPPATTYTTADILESVSGVTCAPDLLTCSSTTLTIPGTFAKLEITLRRDASTIAKNAKIATAYVYYSNPTYPDSRIDYTRFALLPCTDTSYGPLPQTGIPCIARRTEYTRRTAPTADWIGDWEFVIYALDNGTYEQ